MYQIKKFVDAWVIINDDTGEERVLTGVEVLVLKEKYLQLKDDKVKSIMRDDIKGIEELP